MNYCIILASGSGSRMGKTTLPKQFHKVQGKPLICYTLATVLQTNVFDCIYVGVAQEYLAYVHSFLPAYFSNDEITKMHILEGGSTRMDTFDRAYHLLKLENAPFSPEDYICLTDSNRPLTPVTIYIECLEKAKQYGICCPAHPVTDGICVVKKDSICNIPEKKDLYSFQTPECFRILDYERLVKGVEKKSYLGICELFHQSGLNPHIIQSSDRCFKITYPIDWDLLNSYLQQCDEKGAVSE